MNSTQCYEIPPGQRDPGFCRLHMNRYECALLDRRLNDAKRQRVNPVRKIKHRENQRYH